MLHSATQLLKKVINNSRGLILLSLLMCSGCSKIDEETQAKIDYWDQQTNIMTLLGPQKEEVFAWVYAIDPHAKYSGDRLLAKLESLTQGGKATGDCIMLSIKFDERERVRQHDVSLEKRCS